MYMLTQMAGFFNRNCEKRGQSKNPPSGDEKNLKISSVFTIDILSLN